MSARGQPEGFSPGVAVRLRLANGDRVFLKAVSVRSNPDSPLIYHQEAEIARALPPGVPAPRLRWSLEEGPWVALAFDEVDGRPPGLPWRRGELNRVVGAVSALARKLTPSPLPLPSFGDRHRAAFQNWQAMNGGGRPTGKGAGVRFGPWVERNLERLQDLESRLALASKGRTLLHCDIRADNLLLNDEGVYFVDWPWACIGAEWIDLLLFLPSVAMQGGPRPWTIFDRNRLSRRAKDRDVDALLAAFLGFFLVRGSAPPPPGLSTLRPFQWAQGLEVLRWLRYRWEGKDPGRPEGLRRTRATLRA